ncbi:Alpha/Beta hydrolase protein [Microdochium trichocladiopsis]|uniref:Carboxylic ester hydrolase n=1 Tax=Microdochium trichocladiopsis TaxID=1682393 RepID=A0A9P8XZA1_9PEZI|nr:Alpha/Beta hydrolase protein [Microdochium trichocladiopsis]KAH7021293.1 Alpha/Beta hydrolase protein [Microdochium trichocladiopsis]
MKTSFRLASAAVLIGLAAAAPSPIEPVEKRLITSINTAQGTLIGTSLLGVESWGGIPFAEAPVGQLRLRPPVRSQKHLGRFDATGPGPSCPQMLFSTDGDIITQVLGDLINNPFIQKTEDCLTMRVQRPAGTKAGDKLPVLFWIFGGGFEFGSAQMYDGTSLVLNSVAQKKPFIFVSVNYRTGGFGFLGGKEVLADGASNLGLLDQRMGLEWVADNIAAFGGDPDKVTIWGQSAGAISVFDQMALYGGDNTYNGKPLFRGAVMNSGSLAPTDPVDCPKAQAVYDQVVRNAGCSSAADTLACLRGLPYARFQDAVNGVPGILSYTSVALSYLPRPDGAVLPESPEALAQKGRYAAVPMIIGDVEDEGTLFSLFQGNITTEARLVDYLGRVFFNNADAAQMQALVATYPATLGAGSPFRTGLFNIVYPQYKRLAAILGDLVFTLTRRLFLEVTSQLHPEVPSWSYLASYDYGTPILGTFHASDLIQFFYGIKPNYAAGAFQSYLTSFVASLDPNAGTPAAYPQWPQWKEGRQLMQINANSGGFTPDNFRQDSYQWIKANVGVLRL